MKIKSAFAAVGNATLDVLTSVNNSQIDSQIKELDAQIKDLKEQRAELVAKRI